MADLRVGCNGSGCSAQPQSLSIKKNEKISLNATSDCRLCFDTEGVFSTQDYRKGMHELKPKKEGDATYDVVKYGGNCTEHVVRTFSIHVGS